MESLSTTNSKSTVNLLIMNTIGESILVQAFHEAFIYINNSGKRVTKDLRESYFFINGTGLELAIQEYNLDYNADTLRNYFYWKVRHGKNP